MKALIKKGRGPAGLGMDDAAVPGIGKDEVLIKVAVGAICGTDRHIMHDRYPTALPVIIGHEFSGVIVERGENVRGWSEGDRVIAEGTVGSCGACISCTTGHSYVCPDRKFLGITVDGAFAEYVKVPTGALHRVPDGVSMEEASLAEPACVGIHALTESNHVEPGDFVAVLGSGAIALLAAQAAKAVGAAKVLITHGYRASSAAGTGAAGDSKSRVVRELGACDYIVDVAEEDPVKVVREATGGRGADIVLEAAGAAAAVGQAFRMVRRGGVLAIVGMGQESVQVPWKLMMTEAVRIQFCRAYSHTSFERFCALASIGRFRLRPLITAEYPLEDWKSGFEAMEKQGAVKVILRP